MAVLAHEQGSRLLAQDGNAHDAVALARCVDDAAAAHAKLAHAPDLREPLQQASSGCVACAAPAPMRIRLSDTGAPLERPALVVAGVDMDGPLVGGREVGEVRVPVRRDGLLSRPLGRAEAGQILPARALALAPFLGGARPGSRPIVPL